MKDLKILFTASTLAFCMSMPAYGCPEHHAMQEAQHGDHKMAKSANALKMELLPASALKAGKTTSVAVTLSTIEGKKPVGMTDLKEAHTKKLHLLIIDSSLSDYHHIHPVEGQNTGEYAFDFTPNTPNEYRAWADVIPLATGKQEYVKADFGNAGTAAKIDKTVSHTATVNGYTFTLGFDGDLKAGKAVVGNITVTKDGKAFDRLEPIMGTFAHLVGFTADYGSVLHIHPMGKEPTDETARGGPALSFHIEPQHPGFVKLFAQFKIAGQELFVPFGIIIQ